MMNHQERTRGPSRKDDPSTAQYVSILIVGVLAGLIISLEVKHYMLDPAFAKVEAEFAAATNPQI